ncbi:MAG: HEAT repeat domain-containing protein [Ardenticatenaceae bacterium]
MSLATETAPKIGVTDIPGLDHQKRGFNGPQATTMPRKAAQNIKLSKRIRALFAAAKEEVFEDGYESQFSRQLISLVERYGEQAIEPIIRLIVNEQVNPEVAAEALRWLGEIEEPLSRSSRRWLLERTLYSSSSRVRDGAILGLASLDDPHAIPYLRQAIEQESCPELREDMEQVLEQLLESE